MKDIAIKLLQTALYDPKAETINSTNPDDWDAVQKKLLNDEVDILLKSATAKKYRDYIQNGNLALMTSYSPDAGFSVGNAMGRNKQVYALADYALVISAEERRGGTWAGATEELRRENKRPVYIRKENGVPSGNQVLLNMGAKPFPDPPWGNDLLERLESARLEQLHPPGFQKPLFDGPVFLRDAATKIKETEEGYEPDKPNSNKDQEITDLPDTIFDAVQPLLLSALSEWKDSKELAVELEVRKNQVDDWLKKGVEEGLIKKKTRPVRYRRIK